MLRTICRNFPNSMFNLHRANFEYAIIIGDFNRKINNVMLQRCV